MKKSVSVGFMSPVRKLFVASFVVIAALASAAAHACCTLTVSIDVPAYACPGSAIDAAPVTGGNPENHSIDYEWTQDDVPATTFAMPGSGDTRICVTATDSVNGCQDSACVTVLPRAITGLTGPTACVLCPGTYDFTASTDPTSDCSWVTFSGGEAGSTQSGCTYSAVFEAGHTYTVTAFCGSSSLQLGPFTVVAPCTTESVGLNCVGQVIQQQDFSLWEDDPANPVFSCVFGLTGPSWLIPVPLDPETTIRGDVCFSCASGWKAHISQADIYIYSFNDYKGKSDSNNSLNCGDIDKWLDFARNPTDTTKALTACGTSTVPKNCINEHEEWHRDQQICQIVQPEYNQMIELVGAMSRPPHPPYCTYDAAYDSLLGQMNGIADDFLNNVGYWLAIKHDDMEAEAYDQTADCLLNLKTTLGCP